MSTASHDNYLSCQRFSRLNWQLGGDKSCWCVGVVSLNACEGMIVCDWPKCIHSLPLQKWQRKQSGNVRYQTANCFAGVFAVALSCGKQLVEHFGNFTQWTVAQSTLRTFCYWRLSLGLFFFPSLPTLFNTFHYKNILCFYMAVFTAHCDDHRDQRKQRGTWSVLLLPGTI